MDLSLLRWQKKDNQNEAKTSWHGLITEAAKIDVSKAKPAKISGQRFIIKVAKTAISIAYATYDRQRQNV